MERKMTESRVMRTATKSRPHELKMLKIDSAWAWLSIGLSPRLRPGGWLMSPESKALFESTSIRPSGLRRTPRNDISAFAPKPCTTNVSCLPYPIGSAFAIHVPCAVAEGRDRAGTGRRSLLVNASRDNRNQ